MKLREFLNRPCLGQKSPNKHLWIPSKEVVIALRTNDQKYIRLISLKCDGCDQDIIIRSVYSK